MLLTHVTGLTGPRALPRDAYKTPADLKRPRVRPKQKPPKPSARALAERRQVARISAPVAREAAAAQKKGPRPLDARRPQ